MSEFASAWRRRWAARPPARWRHAPRRRTAAPSQPGRCAGRPLPPDVPEPPRPRPPCAGGGLPTADQREDLPGRADDEVLDLGAIGRQAYPPGSSGGGPAGRAGSDSCRSQVGGEVTVALLRLHSATSARDQGVILQRIVEARSSRQPHRETRVPGARREPRARCARRCALSKLGCVVTSPTGAVVRRSRSGAA